MPVETPKIVTVKDQAVLLTYAEENGTAVTVIKNIGVDDQGQRWSWCHDQIAPPNADACIGPGYRYLRLE